MKFTAAQAEISKDKHRFRVLRCGRRFGKTTLAVLRMIATAYAKKEQRVCYIAPTYQQSRDIAWEQLKNVARPIVLSINESRLEIVVRTKNSGTSKIFLRGWEAVETLRGQRFDYLVCDEIREMRGWKTKWEKVLRPTLTDSIGSALFISTPNGYEHFYELCNNELTDKDYKTFHFTSYDNPHLPASELEAAKRQLTPEAFAQEYMADFTKYVGAIYKDFSRDIHVIEPIEIPAHWPVYRAMDFGANNPTVCLWIAMDSNDTFYVFDEYHKPGQTTEFHAGVIKAKTNSLHNLQATWGDPSGNQAMLDYANYGVYITPAVKAFNDSKDWVLSGIKRVQELLKLNDMGKPRLYVFNTCKNIIREFESYHWLETQDRVKDQPDKTDDHCMDALRYGVGSIQDRNYEQYYVPGVVPQANEFTGYSGNIV